MKIRGDWNGSAWGPRRTLICLLEKLVAFPDFFEDCEECLFRLALHENELYIGNNATEIWRNLYCVYLSGTAAPFEQRIGILKGRVSSANIDEARLAFRGLDRVFAGSSGHIVGPPEIAGRLRPEDWKPASPDEERGCYLAALNLCGEHIAHGNPDHRSLAFDVLVNHMDFLLEGGFLDEIAGFFAPPSLKESEARRLMNAVDRFLGFAEQIGRDRRGRPSVGRFDPPIRFRRQATGCLCS